MILSTPCGSGKFLTFSLAVDVLREKTSNQQGIGIVTMPLSAIGEELMNSSEDIAYITMDGEIKADGSHNVKMSHSIEEIIEGKFKMVVGHEESFNSSTGRMLVDALSRENRIIFTGKDEVQRGLKPYWGGTFRPELYSVPAELKTQANKNSPCLVASATLPFHEIEDVKSMMKFRKNLVIIRQNPILDHTRIVNLKRPKISTPFKGKKDREGNLTKQGTQQLLERIILDPFHDAMVSNNFSSFKTTIVFTNTKLGPDLNNYLCRKYPGITEDQRPWVWNHSRRDAATVKDIFSRVVPGKYFKRKMGSRIT